MLTLHTLTHAELEARARQFAESKMPEGNRLQVLILALCDRVLELSLNLPQESRTRISRIMK